jgi:hypothetical protein
MRLRRPWTNKEITQDEIDFRVKRILAAKAWAGLHQYKPIDMNNLNR